MRVFLAALSLKIQDPPLMAARLILFSPLVSLSFPKRWKEQGRFFGPILLFDEMQIAISNRDVTCS